MSAIDERASFKPRRDRRDDLIGLAFALVGVLFGAVLVGLGEDIQRGFGGMSTLAGALPVGYAFAAGMVATVNPCGVMLAAARGACLVPAPAELSMSWSGTRSLHRRRALWRPS